MNKAELIRSLAEQEGLTLKDADRIVNRTLKLITQELVEGGRVQLVGFGAFEVHEHQARRLLNPKTKEPMLLPPRRSLVFRPGKPLKDAISGKED